MEVGSGGLGFTGVAFLRCDRASGGLAVKEADPDVAGVANWELVSDVALHPDGQANNSTHRTILQ